MRNQQIVFGFTLIEVLVVVAILTVILFPVFTKACEKARQATCINNERQIAIALTMYAQDNDETFMPKDPPVWSSRLASYNEQCSYDYPTAIGKGNSNTRVCHSSKFSRYIS